MSQGNLQVLRRYSSNLQVIEMDIRTIWEISRKEFYEHLKTKRFIIISSLYAIVFLVSVWILSHYSGMMALDFQTIISNTHSYVSIFYAILPIALSYDLISGEQAKKSIYLLLSKPVEREEVVIGKILGVIMVICAIIIPVSTVGNLIAGAFRGFPSLDIIARTYIYLVVVIFACTCYVTLSMLFSIVSKSSGISLILSLIGGWFGLNMLYTISLMYAFLTGNFTEIPWYTKVLYAISPSNDLSVALNIISKSSSSANPISVPQSIVALTIFFVVTFLLSLILFKRKELI